jgi:hypothetical protein
MPLPPSPLSSQNAVHDREQQLIAAHRRETALSGETAELERQNAEAFRQFEARAANVKRQMTHAEHAVRAHELTIEKLQQRLQRAVAKEERKREHDKEVFERLTGRAHKPLSSKDQVLQHRGEGMRMGDGTVAVALCVCWWVPHVLDWTWQMEGLIAQSNSNWIYIFAA